MTDLTGLLGPVNYVGYRHQQIEGLNRVSNIQAIIIAQQERMAAASERLVQSLMAGVFG